MKWKVEYITESSCNVLHEDATNDSDTDKVVGMGFPAKLAERIVKMHNEDINNLNKG